MALTIQEIIQILNDGSLGNDIDIESAIQHEDRIKVHTEPFLDRGAVGHPINSYLQWVRGILPADKYHMYLSVLRFPLPTVALCDDIFKSLFRIFDGRNPVSDIEFKSKKEKEGFLDFRNKIRKMGDFWRGDGWYRFKSGINSLVVVDLPAVQSSILPDPYPYFLDVRQVLKAKTDGFSFNWVMFYLPGDRLAVYCDGFYRVFNYKDKTLDPAPISENAHNLKTCPVSFFYRDPISHSNPTVKKSVLTSYLSKLDMVLLFDGGNDHLNIYGRWPITTAMEDDCDFEDSESGIYCDDGFLRNDADLYLIDRSQGETFLSQCPKCSVTRYNGPGSYVKFDPPNPANEQANLRDPISIVTIDRNSLDYNNEDLRAREERIYNSITGFKSLPSGSQAMNSDQIFALLESQEAALKSVQVNFERIIKWTDSIMARLRYNTFIDCHLSMGTKHFILGSSDVLTAYKDAKDAGANSSVLDQLEDLYFQTEYRNNPEVLARQQFIANLDPFRHLSTKEILAMKIANQVNFDLFIIKANLSSFLMRFEREFFPVTEFADTVSLKQRVKVVQDQFKIYAKEMEPTAISEPDPIV